MDPTNEALLHATALIVVLLLVIAFIWWHYSGWSEFSFANGDWPSWAPTDPKDNVSRLRFKDCVFTVQRAGDAAPTSRDVTAALNGMAVAYAGSRFFTRDNYPAALTLARPLNAFSFAIPGFNDAHYLDADGTPRGTVKDPSAPPWCGAGGPAPLACAAAQECANAPGNKACRDRLGGRYGAPCATDADCGGLTGSCNAGYCGTVGSCTGYSAIVNARAGAPCKADSDCDSVAGSCQKGVCANSPALVGICRNCVTDADCGGVAGSCMGYSPGPDPAEQPCSVMLGICSVCPGGATVTLKGLVRAI